MNRKTWVVIVIAVFIIGGFGSVFFDRYFIPYLAVVTGWESLNKLVTTSPIIINRTNEVQLSEGVNLVDIAKQAGNITVTLFTQGNNPSFLGNGIIMTSDGLIFTSKSIINNQRELKVVLSDGRVYTALVRAVDPKSEVVVLTIEEKNLTPASFGNAFDLQVGQRLLAIGESNTAFNRSFSQGYVTNTVANNMSQPSRTYSTEVLENTFETDSIVNSTRFVGSPILNLSGKVVGMSASSALQKIVSAENLQTALNSYLTNNKIVRPRLGVTYLNVSKNTAALKSLSKLGVLVVKTDDASPASGKLLANDLIFEVDGQNLENQSFEQIINKHSVGEIKFKLLRAGKEIEVIVNLEPTK